jgi:periplasmic protein TonB
MFSGLADIEEHHGKRWTAIASFVLQGVIVSAAVILPLLNPAGLPDLKHRLFTPISLGDLHIRASASLPQHGGSAPLAPIVVRNIFTLPSARSHAGSDVRAITDPGFEIVGSETGAQISNLSSGSYSPPVYRPAPEAKPRPVSVMMEGNLIHRVEPQYPAIAKQIRLQGVVVLRAMISSDGTIESVQVVSGPAILAHSAIAAVNQWKYRPYYLNGTPIAVETQITVKFLLNQ